MTSRWSRERGKECLRDFLTPHLAAELRTGCFQLQKELSGSRVPLARASGRYRHSGKLMT